MYQSFITSLPLIARGKVRDIYAVGDDKLLLVTCDRLSAYDVILPTPIPHKGEILVELANFWFAKLQHIVPNQLTGIDPASVVAQDERDQVRGRAIVVNKYKVLPIEAVVRGYLEGSGWSEYQQTQSVCGVKLPAGLQRASKLPEPIFTPATKALAGEHDENIDFATTEKIIGAARAAQVREVAIRLYTEAAEYALTKGIIIADTKFEFGLDGKGQLHLIDEVLTPDSSRFWPLATYKVGSSPESFDKQYIRNWLDSIGFNRRPPAPDVPADIAQRTSDKYREALDRLTAKN
ncbi:MAG: phosphoribosylaminoimidazolesuccinocarboxamide synthase [Burkholderiales bacterium]|jgi:phosphoribosylaminoimidazole-succinocarboxamide synthase|nr:phosphoribosylaminoimidazolesuccinocarboxamide synthase [Rhodocyclaceae bacterium]MCA3017207.1 phosphoribosylaminoimidazolesuccinocarboxamide synthase [Rhodocyclaceae bacterium]MCA3022679.1 phosphoribosylaminoimidazolesuccinocarboxamide synthase [Rhodocyclaceae bacterium]MCA3026011.1 phosphoribosylaminoimidazolesuccinocarboxamide synthase [Rhodocyclaceae bacterium]MCA3031724.1 phosphoribosylaminoimidazolesuccinocarboxamide synthase [Rhodocyclaceae bacterium]